MPPDNMDIHESDREEAVRMKRTMESLAYQMSGYPREPGSWDDITMTPVLRYFGNLILAGLVWAHSPD